MKFLTDRKAKEENICKYSIRRSVREVPGMFLVNQAMVDLQIGTAGLVALLGYAVVFVGLIALMVVILIEGKFAVAKDQKTEAPQGCGSRCARSRAEARSGCCGSGSAGEVKLFNVPDKDAAMLMAIVANKLNKPLNELRFKSIKEVK